jgi:hypothetical protein
MVVEMRVVNDVLSEETATMAALKAVPPVL